MKLFRIIKNTLNKDGVLYRCIHLRSDHYDATFWYEGDYVKDFENRTLNPKRISLNGVGHDEFYGALTLLYQKVHLEFSEIECTQNEIQDIINEIPVLIEHLEELESIYAEYFPKDRWIQNGTSQEVIRDS